MHDPLRDTQSADRAAEEESSKAYELMALAAATATFAFYMKGGRSRVNQFLQETGSPFLAAAKGLTDTSVRESIRRSHSSFMRGHMQDYPDARGVASVWVLSNKLEKIFTANTLERVRNLPDAWGQTFQQRAANHLTTFKQSVASQISLVDRSRAMAEVGILRLTKLLDRDAFKRAMRQVETGSWALAGSAPAKHNFARATSAIRKWAAAHIGEIVPIAMLDKLRGALSTGWRMALEAGLQSRALALRDNMVALVRNLSNRIFQETTLFFAEGFRNSGAKAVRWNLSPAHKVFDQCDVYAGEDMGIGQGVYYLGYVPFPAHVNCMCFLTTVYDLKGKSPNPDASIQQRLMDLRRSGEDANY